MNHDITFCMTESCPLRKKCFRGKIPMDETRLSFSVFEPTKSFLSNEIRCLWFIEIPEDR